MELWYSLVELLPFEWAQAGSMYFMKNALLAVLVISPLFGILSTMVVHSRMSFFSDALGHSALTGVGIGVLLGLADQSLIMVVFAVIFALLILSLALSTTIRQPEQKMLREAHGSL